MITRIEVDGFKSLRGFAVDLEPLTAIVGPNGAGKSNLFDALQLLSRLAERDVINAFGMGRGSRRDQFSRMQGGEVAQRMSLAVDMLIVDSPVKVDQFSGPTLHRQSRLHYEIEIGRTAQPSGVEVIGVHPEKLGPITRAEDAWIGRHPELVPWAWYEREGDRTSTLKTDASFKGPNPFSVAALHHILRDSFIESLYEELHSFRFLQLEPAKLRLPSDRAAPTELAPDGSNLPTALAALAPEIRAEIRADLARHVPSFKSFEVVAVDDELRIEVELTSGQRLPGRVLSDGTLRLLALFLLLRSARPGALIAIEEPENGVHPGSFRALVEELIEATTPRGVLPPQVLLNSHSPALVAALHHRPASLVFADLVRRADGVQATRMRHVWREGDPKDRGATTVSMHEVERILNTARPADEVA